MLKVPCERFVEVTDPLRGYAAPRTAETICFSQMRKTTCCAFAIMRRWESSADAMKDFRRSRSMTDLRNLVATLEPGSHYISSSADGPVSGHGPYRVEPLRYYFEHAPTKLHSEMGSPNVVEMDDLRRTMPESAMWPQGYQWPLHDYHEQNPFTTAVDKQYGGATDVARWVSFAQFVDYDAYRGMFEGQSKNRLGLLIWMSHPAWPSLLWQTYDYFFDTDAGYYGAKKAAEPLHIQWNAATDAVEVVNYNAGEQAGLTAHAQVINIDGTVKWEKSATLDSHEDSTASPMQLEFPAGLARTHFIRLTLTRGNRQSFRPISICMGNRRAITRAFAIWPARR